MDETMRKVNAGKGDRGMFVTLCVYAPAWGQPATLDRQGCQWGVSLANVARSIDQIRSRGLDGR